MAASLRTAITLAVLALFLLVGVTWGFAQMTKPFPGKAEPPICVDTTFAAGDELYPQDVTVSVLNASKREGLAGRTMQLFTDDGFAEGQTSNAPPGTDVSFAEIWTSDGNNPGVKLVRTRMGQVPVRERPDLTAAGIVVVVGDEFEATRPGVDSVVLKHDAVVCGPSVE